MNDPEDIERKLQALNGVKDRRSKDEVYQNIQLKMNTKKQPQHRFRKSVVWGLSTSAAIVLTVIIVSQFPPPGGQEQFTADESSEMAEEDDHEEYTESEDTAMEKDDSISAKDEIDLEEAPPEEENIRPDPEVEEETMEDGPGEEETSDQEKVEEMEEVYTDIHYRQAVQNNDDAFLTLPFLAPDEETIVAVTAQHSLAGDTDRIEEILDQINSSDLGLNDSPLQAIRDEENQSINADDLDHEKITQSLNEAARYETEEDLEEAFQWEGADAEASAGYYWLAANENAYLVTGKSLNIGSENEKDLQETLKEMEREEEDRYHSVVPEGVRLEYVDMMSEGSVALTYSGLEQLSEKAESEWLMFIEGVLLTAADFGYDEVEFEGDLGEVEQVGPYELDETLHPPRAPNFVGEVGDDR
ncbi:hypothetical protein HNR44_003258 [Geomicrobium halophilum]|uniref:Sporulation and spore germination n=1 Tax=Geomicrobium halophilum TaxID=549000 RepID=A0A841PU17_9BACL|nr:hypothetical protein [Geomicrobium halophilum]MBB6451264.1 hypothetical protein [Geomicrobium halophilum]